GLQRAPGNLAAVLENQRVAAVGEPDGVHVVAAIPLRDATAGAAALDEDLDGFALSRLEEEHRAAHQRGPPRSDSRRPLARHSEAGADEDAAAAGAFSSERAAAARRTSSGEASLPSSSPAARRLSSHCTSNLPERKSASRHSRRKSGSAVSTPAISY